MKKLLSTVIGAASLLVFSSALSAAALSQQTLQNLNAAFNGESNANHRYTAFAQQADKEGKPQIARLFRAAAKAEQIHRDNHRKTILDAGGKLDERPLDEVKLGTTEENLKAALAGESYERDTMYPKFIATATAEGNREAVRTFRFAVEAEKQHAVFYQQALEKPATLQDAKFYVCPVCGNTVTTLPDTRCPVCRKGADQFEAVN
ncbi:rubrerythrin [Opitutaceae bacterium EW11]|nr:rubrerythrin [Opitutaceae bacterium EW11]